MGDTFIPFVTIPYLTSQLLEEIHYKDILIYGIVKSFRNSETGLCCPSYESIAKIANTGRKFVSESLQRLEKAKLVFIDRSNKPKVVNRYYFARLDYYNRIPVEVMKVNLTANQKAMLICMAQFFIGEGIRIPRNIKDKAARLGLSYKMLYSQYMPLVKEGFIIETVKQYKFSDQSKVYHELSDKIEWIYHNNDKHYKESLDKKRLKFIMDGPSSICNDDLKGTIDIAPSKMILM